MVTYGVKLERSDDLRLPRHRDAPGAEGLSKWCADLRGRGERLAADLFSGAGGLSHGIEDAGWTVAVSVDHDAKALQTHSHNFAGLALPVDMGDPDEVDKLVGLLQPLGIDLIAGGPPCQPFSRAGRSKIRSLVRSGQREADDRRRYLWRSFLKVALAVKPRAVLMENVPDMALGDDLRAVREIVEQLEATGYHTQVRLVDAWRYGVPQHRKRLIVLARHDTDIFSWPEEATGTNLRDAIGDLPPLNDTTGGRSLTYSAGKETSEFATAMRKDAPDTLVHDHMTRPVRDDDREVFKLMDSTTLYSSIPEEMRRYKADTFDDKYKRLGWDDLSRSITAHIARDGYWYIHPQENRTLTVREAARIQTFPDRFRFAGTRSDAFRQIGNAVPPLLGKAAATAVAPAELMSAVAGAGGDTATDRSLDQLREQPPSKSKWLDARRELAAWGRGIRRNPDLWFQVPGERLSPPLAAIAAMLGTRRVRTELIADLLEDVGEVNAALGAGQLMRVQLALGSSPAGTIVKPLKKLLMKRTVWTDTDLAASALGMGAEEARFYRLLCGEDVLLTNQAAFRVAARVAGSDSDSRNRLSDGRLDVARLVGSGHDAPLRMATLRVLGQSHCTPAAPRCSGCPLAIWCETYARFSVKAIEAQLPA